jgi:hypothetical protein
MLVFFIILLSTSPALAGVCPWITEATVWKQFVHEELTHLRPAMQKALLSLPEIQMVRLEQGDRQVAQMEVPQALRQAWLIEMDQILKERVAQGVPSVRQSLQNYAQDFRNTSIPQSASRLGSLWFQRFRGVDPSQVALLEKLQNRSYDSVVSSVEELRKKLSTDASLSMFELKSYLVKLSFLHSNYGLLFQMEEKREVPAVHAMLSQLSSLQELIEVLDKPSAFDGTSKSVLVVPSAQTFTIPQMNDELLLGAYSIELPSVLAAADGRLMTPLRSIQHDHGHSKAQHDQEVSLQMTPTQMIDRYRKMQKIRSKVLMTLKTRKEKHIAECLYFMLHENPDILVASTASRIVKNLQAVYLLGARSADQLNKDRSLYYNLNYFLYRLKRYGDMRPDMLIFSPTQEDVRKVLKTFWDVRGSS